MSNDKYSSLAALKTAEVRHRTYRIFTRNRRAPLTLISPHGGFIEPGTSHIMHALASDAYNLFDFQGLQRDNPQDLHVTSTRFRDPDLDNLLRHSTTALSIHGMHDQGMRAIWLGGLNQRFKHLMLHSLRTHDFPVDADSPRYRGTSPANIVNQVRYQGVQLEISNELFADLFIGERFAENASGIKTTGRFAELTRALRQAIRSYLQETETRWSPER